jgi:simple sugar transport system permease protein
MTMDRVAGFGPASSVGESRSRRLLARALTRHSLATLVVLVAVVLFFAVRTPGLFSAGGVAAMLDVAATLGIGAVAVTMLLIAGQFDLTIGTVAAGSSLVTTLLAGSTGWGIWPSLGVSLAAALAVGVLNGVLVVSTGLPSFLVTLATFLALQGLTGAGAGLLDPDGPAASAAPGWRSAAAVFGSTVRLGDGTFRVSLLWWAGATLLAAWVLRRTRFGNAVFASGGARRAARELGVPVRRTTITLFCLTATAGWLLGTLTLLRSGSPQTTSGLTTDVDLIIVAVLGGCLISGGYGSAIGAALGALLYGTTQEGIRLAGWGIHWFQALLGLLLLVAVLANGVVRQRLKVVPRS